MLATLQRAGFRFAFVQIRSPAEELPFALRAPFGCLLWDDRKTSNRDDRQLLTRTLLSLGCATLACGGTDCEAWHDAADEELAEISALDASERFVMTTWHTDETPEQVARYFADQAVIDDRAVRENIVVYLGATGTTLEKLRSAVEAVVGTPLWAEFASDAI